MMNRKLAVTIGACALTAVIGIGATLAFLSDVTNDVNNTFTLGNVKWDRNKDNPDEDENAGLTESRVTRGNTSDSGQTVENGKGVYQDNDGSDTWNSIKNDYTSVKPGEVMLKDPTVHLDPTSEDAYVVVKVTYNTEHFDNIDWNIAGKDNGGKGVDVIYPGHDADEKESTEWKLLEDNNGVAYLLYVGNSSSFKKTGEDAAALKADQKSTIFNNVTATKAIEQRTTETVIGNTTYYETNLYLNGQPLVNSNGEANKLDEIVIRAAAIQFEGMTEAQAITEAKALLG